MTQRYPWQYVIHRNIDRYVKTTTLAALCVLMSIPRIVQAQNLISVGIDQLSYLEPSPSVSQPYSNYGQADLVFDASSSIQYVNIALNGALVVQDVPVPTVSGTSTQAMSFDFNLGNSIGTQVTSSLNYVAIVTPTPLYGVVPTPATPGAISGSAVPTQINATVGGLDGPITSIPSAVNLIGDLIGLLPTDVAIHTAIPNQDVKVGECAPGAFSNSLSWLNATQDGDIPSGVASLAGMDDATGYVDESGVDGPSMLAGKTAAVMPWVKTQLFGLIDDITSGSSDFDKALAAMQKGADVELVGEHHVAAVSGLIKLQNGDYVVYVTHDTNQGHAGGTVTEPVIYDPTTGLLTGGAPGFFGGFGVRGFIAETVVPEPGGMVLFGFGAIFLGVFARWRCSAQTGSRWRKGDGANYQLS